MLSIDDLPTYVSQLDETALAKAKKNAKAAENIRMNITKAEIEEIQESIDIEKPIDDEVFKKINNMYKRLNKDIVLISSLFIECKDYLSVLTLHNRKIKEYLIKFNDLDILRELVSEYSQYKTIGDQHLYFIQETTRPYVNSMVSLIHFTNYILNIFTKGEKKVKSGISSLLTKFENGANISAADQ